MNDPKCTNDGGPNGSGECQCSTTTDGQAHYATVKPKVPGECWPYDPWYSNPPTKTTNKPPPTHAPIMTATVATQWDEVGEVTLYISQTTTWGEVQGKTYSGPAPAGTPYLLQKDMEPMWVTPGKEHVTGASECRNVAQTDALNAALRFPDWLVHYPVDPGEPDSDWAWAHLPYNLDIYASFKVDSGTVGANLDNAYAGGSAEVEYWCAQNGSIDEWKANPQHGMTKPQIVEGLFRMYSKQVNDQIQTNEDGDVKMRIGNCGLIHFGRCILKVDYCTTYALSSVTNKKCPYTLANRHYNVTESSPLAHDDVVSYIPDWDSDDVIPDDAPTKDGKPLTLTWTGDLAAGVWVTNVTSLLKQADEATIRSYTTFTQDD
ncbi:hypothetical protein NUU61_000008 [Penicillium alfredii]|uniref:Uncharacterized protein n=1 Tax=Penicillium alfredii TaxID=1506179 RepID=A0A9W9G8S4_9EURO|nr:uncharacterized protein NUU61_000008 [Penicillium alfredii]KAJ5114249.1 hypothetical protein NUU61_000008 [Penicillium alfredii]